MSRFVLFRLAALWALPLACAAEIAPAVPSTVPARASNWQLPLFTKEGFHSMSLSGSEALPVGRERIDITDVTIIVFSGDAAARVDTVLLSPKASYFPRESRASGPGWVRLVRDDCEISGEDWTYDQSGKRVSIRQNVHVVFKEALQAKAP